ncbi:MAG: hypothetical protein JRN68_05365 [Nitrososphaerota archaeon]|nr:hypothetical protein [Nitrososphaerota archaeon]
MPFSRITSRKKFSFLVPLLLILISIPTGQFALHDSSAEAATCAPSINPFTVSNVGWSGNSQGVGPGDGNVQLVVSMVYSGGCPVTYAQFQLGLKSPFSAAFGGGSSSSSESSYQVNLPSFAQFQLVYSLNIAGNATTGVYQLPMTITFDIQNATGFGETTEVSVPLLGSVQLGVGGITSVLSPGQVNNVTLYVYNMGTGNSTSVQLSFSQPSQGLSVLTQIPSIPLLKGGEKATLQVQMFASNSVQGQPVTLPISISYVNSYGVQNIQQGIVGFYVQSLTSISFGSPLSVSTLTPTVPVGQSSTLEIIIRNTGRTAISSPYFTFTVPAGFAVVSNSTFSEQGMTIPSGGTFLFDVNVSSGPKTPESAYSGQLAISYLDSLGNLQTTTIPVGFVAVGRIVLAVQSIAFSETGGVLTMSGTLLNEGTSSAYYLQLNATVEQNAGVIGQGNGYVGEVDPNTPIPFTVQVALPSSATNGSASVSLRAGYLNDYGQQLNSTLPGQTFQLTLTRTSTVPSGGSGGVIPIRNGRGLFILSVLVLLAGIILIVAAVYLSRRRSGSKKAEDYADQDKKVI